MWHQFWNQSVPLWLLVVTWAAIILIGVGVESNCKRWIEESKRK